MTEKKRIVNTSLAAKGGHSLTTCIIQNGRWGLERSLPPGFGNRQLLLNKFCVSSTPSMRKVDNGEMERKMGRKHWEKKEKTSCHYLVAVD